MLKSIYKNSLHKLKKYAESGFVEDFSGQEDSLNKSEDEESEDEEFNPEQKNKIKWKRIKINIFFYCIKK